MAQYALEVCAQARFVCTFQPQAATPHTTKSIVEHTLSAQQ